MTDDGLRRLAEIRFDVEQLTVQCDTERERELVAELDRAVKNMVAELDYRYNRRKKKIVKK